MIKNRLISLKRILSNRIIQIRRYTTHPETVHVDHLVIGGGLVGLAITERLSRDNPSLSTVMLERHAKFGSETSSRNSEVIHSGIYYPPGSLKSRLCIEGKQMLYTFCDKHRVPYSRMGKWIVAVEDNEVSRLHALHERANELDIPTYFESKEKARIQEPHVHVTSVLVSPTTGIIDSHSFMETLESLACSNGAYMMYNTTIMNIVKVFEGFEVFVQNREGHSFRIISRVLVNAAGLGAYNVASYLLGSKAPPLYYYKGRYYKYASSSRLVSRLIYPMPDASLKSLGVHVTLDLDGQIKFGPNIEPAKNETDYSIDDPENEIRDKFYESVRKYIPYIERDRFVPDYCGIRPKLSRQEDPGFRDFLIQEPISGFVNLMGIESPGLTSSLAIADYVKNMVLK